MKVGELGFVEDDGMMTMDEIDWEHLLALDDIPENGVDFADPPATSTGPVDSWIGEVERLLMNDDDFHGKVMGLESNLDFQVSDILLYQPEQQEVVVVDASSPPENEDKKNSPASTGSTCSPSEGEGHNNNNNTPISDSNCDDVEKLDAAAVEVTDSKHDDPASKKRKRQLRNRDAAMRSRERKKMYVKDLEIKSRYLEAECRRLGRLLQCCYAENQMLRISLQSGSTFGASMTKPESAVLLLESLLLGSLVWFMALMCLSPLPRLSLLSQDAVALGSMDREDLESAVPREKGMEAIEVWLPLSYVRSKRCRASRTKMKSSLFCSILLV